MKRGTDDDPSAPSHERRLPQGAARARVWRDVGSARFVVRCNGVTLLVVGEGEPAPLGGTFRSLSLHLVGEKIMEVAHMDTGEIVPLGDVGPLRVHCKHHSQGHLVDGRELRSKMWHGASQCKIADVEPH